MRPYEVMVIFDVGVEPPAIQAVVDRLLESIRTNEGVPGHVDRWGRRPFAYEVKHRREGYYMLVELSGEPRTVAEIDRLLTLADEVLRFKVIRLPDKIAARLASGAPSGGSHARPGGRGPSTRGPGGRGPRTDGSGRSADAARATSGEDAVSGRAGPVGPAPASPEEPAVAEEGESTGAAEGAAAPAAG
jgi:small subunit ribosomal protein S6